MALTLTLREGHDFYAGDTRFLIAGVITPMVFAIEDTNGLTHTVTSEGWVEIAEGVRVCSGIPRKQEGKVVRLLVEAPGIKVLRGDLYREKMRKATQPPTHHIEKEVRSLHGACDTCHGTGYLTQLVWKGGKQVQDQFPCPDC